ncbi:MAG: outer membrane beta-barrel protein [Usitatibacter sp.]
MNRKSALALATLAVLATPAFAQTSPWYGGLAVGQSRTGGELVTNRNSTVVGGTVTNSAFDDKDSGFRIFGGYRFLPWLGVELNYADIGASRLRTDVQTIDAPFNTGAVVLDRKISGFGADLVFSAPLGERASIFGRVGAVQSRLEANAKLSGLINFTSGNTLDRERTTTVNETVTRFGLGADYMLSRNLGIRLDWERWLSVGKKFEIGGQGTTGEADTDFYSVGVIYRF